MSAPERGTPEEAEANLEALGLAHLGQEAVNAAHGGGLSAEEYQAMREEDDGPAVPPSYGT